MIINLGWRHFETLNEGDLLRKKSCYHQIIISIENMICDKLYTRLASTLACQIINQLWLKIKHYQ